MKLLYDEISVREIKRQKNYTLHPFFESDYLAPQLFRSIKTVGILTPPIIIPHKNSGYDVVCGRQRLYCFEQIGANYKCLCKILPKSAAAEEILTIVLEDQAASGELSIVEQASFLSLCDRLLPDKNRCEAFLAGLPENLLNKGYRFLRPLKTLNIDIQRKIHDQVISEKVAAELQKLSSADQMHFVNLVEQFAIGGNRQKNLLIQLVDIARRENISFSVVLEELGTAEMIQKEITSGQKLKLLIEGIEKRHHPLYWQAKASFFQEVDKMKLPDTYAINPSPSFERDEVMLTIRFETLGQLKKDLPKVLSITGDDTSK